VNVCGLDPDMSRVSHVTYTNWNVNETYGVATVSRID